VSSQRGLISLRHANFADAPDTQQHAKKAQAVNCRAKAEHGTSLSLDSAGFRAVAPTTIY
jgi:hypothetical protein